jgi:hypothetical protein
MLRGRCINWFGLAAGALFFAIIFLSLYIPWWQLTIGDKIVQINASPVNTNFNLISSQFTVPLLWAWNIASILLLVLAATTMLIYSLVPNRPHAKDLLDFSYKKPIYVVISFVVGLLIMVVAAGFLGFSLPLMGKSNVALPAQFMPSGVSVSLEVTAGFQLTFWLTIAATALFIVARLYHPKLVSTISPPPPQTAVNPVNLPA